MAKAPELVIGIGKAGPAMDGGGEPDADDAGGDSSGVMATTAFCKAHQRGDYAAAYDAFKEMLLAADQDLEAEQGSEPSMPEAGA